MCYFSYLHATYVYEMVAKVFVSTILLICITFGRHELITRHTCNTPRDTCNTPRDTCNTPRNRRPLIS